MNKRKIAALIASVVIINFSAPSIEVLADEVSKKVTAIVESKSTKATISKFELLNNSNIGSYDKVFKMDNSNIESITNNGGNYVNSTLDKSLDGNFNTHWETGKQNNSEFTNEVVFKLKEETTLNRIVYAARQSSAKGKGFAKELEIYGSLTDDGDDFRLVCSGEYAGSTGDTVGIKFHNTQFKRIKFKFTKANENWASASEFMFYKEDKISDKMKNLFTDATMSKVSAEFNSIEKINALDEEAKSHPLYSNFKEDIENAKLIVENKNVNYIDAKVSKFKDMNSEELPKYDAIYKVPESKIKSITTNGGQYASEAITKAMDGDINTKWHSGKQNSEGFTNEVIIELNELTKLNRVVYTAPRRSKRGFAEQFDIYASRTTKGDTFELVSSGSSQVTQDSIEIRFNPTEFRRVKFVFKKGYEDWACAAEFGLYTQDKVAEKMDRLFTDSTMGTVSEEFNTIEKIKVLEEEAKNHPFYEDYKEDIENAITILNSSEIVYTDAKIKSFNVDTETLKKYENMFKVPFDKINKISNNGGRYSDLVIENAIDGDVNTRWHSGKQNTDTFKNEVIIELKEIMKLNRILFKASIGTYRGFPEKFEIYASNTSKGDNFKLVSKGATSPTQDTLEFKFNEAEFKRIKFVYAKGYEDWATASEISLYKEDKLNDKVESLFKDTLMTKVSDEYNTIEKLDGLAEEVKGHPLENELMTIINLAKKVVNEPGKAESSVWELESRGNSIKESQKRKIWNFQDWQPTGYAAKSGEVISVYVDVEDGKPTPQLVFKQMDSQHNGNVVIKLNKGRNVITVPELPTGELRPGTPKSGVFYTSNPYTPEEQGRKPKIRIEGAIRYPHYIKGVHTDEEVMKDLENYVELLKEDPSLPDVFDVFSDKTLVNVKATYALDWFKKNNKLPSETADKSDEVIKETMKFWGFDGSSEVNSDFNFRYITMVKWLDNGGFMNAGNGITGFNKAEQGAVLDVNTGWGLMHEMGHNFDTNNRSIGEVTNNILPLHFERIKGETSRITKQNLWEKNILPKVALEDYSNNEYYPESDTTLLSHIAPLWQLQLYDETFWPKFEQEFRSKNIGGGNWDNKHNAWVKVASDVLKLDLSEHFARHGMDVWEETKEYTSKYPKPSKKLWYANDRMYLNKGGVFTDDVKYEANAKIVNNNEVVLNFSIDKENKNNVIGYEIFRDGETIGFTSTNSFTDRKATLDKNHNYTVIAYDNELNASKPYDLNLHAPTINVESNVILALNESFNPLDYVKAYNYEGNDISNKIKIVKNDVNTSKKGSYDVTYEVTDEGDTKTKKLKVQVVSEYDYLSDFEWNFAETQWGTPRRNTNIKGRVNGEVKEFEKGFGIHANGKIIYSLEGKEYDRFVAQVGVDVGIPAQNNSSITFNIIGDGKILASTLVLKHADNLVGIDVPVSGVKELVIEVTDSGNGNTSDHGIIVNPKLTTNNAKPRITAKDKIYKTGDTVDFKEGISARDAEDGDLTSNIEIISNSYKEGKTGRFEVVYKVTDSDNNTVEKKAYITVYEDFSVVKSKYGQFDNLNEYNKQFKIPIVSVTNNGGRYFNSFIEYAIDNNRNTHWETGKPNSSSFKNEVIFNLGETTEISRMAFAARNGGKGFAKKFEIYVSTEAEGDDFILAGKGQYNGNVNDVVEFNISKTNARRVKFKFIEANQDWASIGEMAFYREDTLADKVNNDLFTDSTKTEVSDKYNTLEKVQALREEVKNHPAAKLFEEDLKKAEEIIIAKLPTLSLEKVSYVKLNSDFNVMLGVSANDQEDGDITKKVTIDKGDFTVNKTGKYTITYKVTDSDGNEIAEKRTIIVYSDSRYISDLDWESARTDYGQVRKDLASTGAKIKLSVNGEEKVFDKGIGTHANAELVYNLEGENYEYFESYVGVDRNIEKQNNSSIIFKVLADGKEVYNSGLMKWADDAKLVRVPLKGVNELKLVIDNGGNGNAYDHGDFADAKFLITNAKPNLTIPESASTKVGQQIDLRQEYSAIDAEDGDITSKVEVTGKVNFNKTGKYKMTYKVIDSDDNEVIKTRIISVVDMKDYRYLTDYDWKSANSGWKTVNKDKSVDNNKLTLTGEEGQAISYDRGIGTHATSTIVYDLSDKDYAYFSSYVGVDREMHGSVGSISFEVYVDGEKKFDSGIMNSRDPQKYVEVDINGAKELKLVVKDGGNGNGSDHATWGDAKLHFANDIKGNYEELESLVKEAKNYEKDMYTEESFKVLEEALNKAEAMLEDKISNQDEINSMIKELNKAISNLENNVDLNEVITIKDKYLKDVIKKELNLSSDNITIGDMYKLTKLSASNKWISSLEGLEHAKNLESLDISYNEIKDLSPLKNLKKLTNLNANLQIITEGMLYVKDNKITLDYKVLNRNGEKLKPKEIVIKSNRSDEAMDLSLDELVDENGVISFDISNFDKYLHSIYLIYEDEKDNFLTQSLYMFDVR